MKFSIVIPLYNKQDCIRQALDCVFNQSFQDFEVIVVDDGSTDSGAEIVREYKDERLRLISQKNSGVSSARNAGIAAARNSWIAFLDADDIWTHLHLETLAKLHEKFPQAEMLCTNYEKISSNENYTDKLEHIEQKVNCYIVNNLYVRLLKDQHIIWSSTAAIKKQCFEKAGGFDTKLIKGEDLDCWFRLKEQFTLAQTDFVTAFYRIDPPEGNATNKVSSVRKYQVYYFKPDFWTWNFKSMFMYRVIYGYLKHFLVYKQPKNFLLLLFRHNFKLLRIFFYRNKAKQLGIRF